MTAAMFVIQEMGPDRCSACGDPHTWRLRAHQYFTIRSIGFGARENIVKDIGTAILIVIGVCVAVVGISWGGFALYATFQPKYVQVQNKTFHESQQYNDGMAQQLSNYQIAYLHATSAESKSAIKAIIIQQYAAYDEDRLPPNLRSFLDQIRESQ